MNTQWLKARQTKYTGFLLVYVIIIVGVLGLANFLAQRYNKSWDATANKQFSLSDQTIKVVKGLNQDVTIDYFDKTSNISDPRGNARDLLDRYANLSPKVHVNYVDPTRKPEIAKAAVRTFGTVFIQAAGRKQEAKSVSEEEITGALVRALKGNERTVCVVTGSGEHALDNSNEDGYSTAKELLEKNNYKTQPINLLQKQEVPKECTILFVGGPRLDYVPAAVEGIKKYVEGGGRALFALDPPLQFKGQEIADNAALTGQLANWGVTVDKDLVIDPNPVNRLFGFTAAVVLVNEYESQQIVRDLKGAATAFPLVRSLDVKSGDKATVDKLFTSSADAFGATNLTSTAINPSDKNNKKGPLTLAAAGTYNTGQPNNNGRFVVVGSSSWIANNIMPSRSLANRDLFLNMMNWLSSDEDLISIRPKEPENRPLAMTVRQMRVLMYSTLIFLPLIILVSGLSVWWRRR